MKINWKAYIIPLYFALIIGNLYFISLHNWKILTWSLLAVTPPTLYSMWTESKKNRPSKLIVATISILAVTAVTCLNLKGPQTYEGECHIQYSDSRYGTTDKIILVNDKHHNSLSADKALFIQLADTNSPIGDNLYNCISPITVTYLPAFGNIVSLDTVKN